MNNSKSFQELTSKDLMEITGGKKDPPSIIDELVDTVVSGLESIGLGPLGYVVFGNTYFSN